MICATAKSTIIPLNMQTGDAQDDDFNINGPVDGRRIYDGG